MGPVHRVSRETPMSSQDHYKRLSKDDAVVLLVDHQSGLISGSSRFTGKCCFYLQKEVVVIPVAVGHPLDHLDLVVHSLQHTGVQPVDHAGDNAVDVALEAPMVDGLDRMPMQP